MGYALIYEETAPAAVDRLPDLARKGRGAISNEVGRFEPQVRDTEDDGWGTLSDDWAMPARLATEVAIDASRSVIARNQSPDIPFDRSINPYRGCEHGCVYCFARPSHAFLGLSPGLDFETRLFAKPDAATLLRRELRKPGYRCETIALGTNTDPYQPVEKDLSITRSVLQVLSDCDHPVSIVTKSALVTRDIDILADMAQRGLASVLMSVTTLDRGMARTLEPRAPTPFRRLAAVEALAEAGIPVGVLTAPIIPAINDHEIEAILRRAADAGATTASYVLLRLPLEIKELFEEWLRAHFPGRADRVLSLIRQSHGGALYRAEFGTRMRGSGAYADMIRKRHRLACDRLDLSASRAAWTLDTGKFRPPAMPGDQMSLF